MCNLIDLSLPMKKNAGEIAKYTIKQIDHKKGGNIFGKKFNLNRKGADLSKKSSLLKKRSLKSSDFPDEEFLNLDIITASTHTGTHIDAPFHYGSHCEGKLAMTIDEVPIEWFFGDGVLLDMPFKKPGEYINKEDILFAIEHISYDIKPYDIVLIKTGADKYWGTKEYLTKYPGMSRESIKVLTDLGVKVIGIDSYGFDRPFSYMINDYIENGDKEQLFQAHFFGREKCYCQIERLTNLDKLSKPYGFKVACFPIKITGSGAAWSRVVAIE
ncbi:cyclase family protein [Clostridium botulinum]|uniref:Cyclase family protein n=1 Tax=Clostridium botulinum TaxID=1491 RepID=A0A6M0SR51_CLOBO|nr:cyclase family protein [Clostridium botulinum]